MQLIGVACFADTLTILLLALLLHYRYILFEWWRERAGHELVVCLVPVPWCAWTFFRSFTVPGAQGRFCPWCYRYTFATSPLRVLCMDMPWTLVANQLSSLLWLGSGNTDLERGNATVSY